MSLTITPGAPTLIIGPNGAGKTTLLRLCMGLAAPSTGRITWGGRADRAPARRAMLFQRPVMLRRTAAANLAYALAQAGMPRRQRPARIAALLERVGLSDLARRPARRLRAASSSGWRWRGRWRAIRKSCCSMSRPPISIPQRPVASRRSSCCAAQSGIKIVMASHDLGQLRRLAGEVIFLVRGGCARGWPAIFSNHPATPEAAAFLRGDLVV